MWVCPQEQTAIELCYSGTFGWHRCDVGFGSGSSTNLINCHDTEPVVHQKDRFLVGRFLSKDCLRSILSGREAATEVLDFQKIPI